jgi:hypothetical protein
MAPDRTGPLVLALALEQAWLMSRALAKELLVQQQARLDFVSLPRICFLPDATPLF